MAVDPNIKKKADDIRNKIYGKEVRESLASGLEAMSSDVVDNTDRQDEVEGQFQDLLDETTGKDIINGPEIIAARNGEANLKARLDKEHQEVTAQLAQMATNVKTFGAIGDGNSHPLSERFQYLSQAQEVYPHAYSLDNEIDWCAIQSAVEFVKTNGGGLVYLPKGTYVTKDTIELDSNIEFVGAGMYLTILYPIYQGDNAFQNLIQISGTASDRKKDIVLRDFGIDVSDDTLGGNNHVEQWARIHVRQVNNFKANNIFYYHGSHLFQMYGCENFMIDNIRCDYSFNVVHMVSDTVENKQGIISNIIATRVATVLDWGAGGIDIQANNVYGNNEGFPRNDQEAIDIGGATNIKISNALFRNFVRGLTLKGETQKEWGNVELNNVTFLDVIEHGIRGTRGDAEQNTGHLVLNNVKVISDVMQKDGSYCGLALVGGSAELNNVVFDVTGNGLIANLFNHFEISNLKIKAEERGFRFDSPEDTINGSWNIDGLIIESDLEALYLSATQSQNMLNNFHIKGSNTNYALNFNRVSNPVARNGLIYNANSHAIHLNFGIENIHQPNEVNGLLAELSNITIRDWGTNSAYRMGLSFTVPDVTGAFTGLRLKDLNFEITGAQNSQNGIVWSAFTNKIDYSWFDGITFYRVPSEQTTAINKGDNNIERIMSIK